MLAILAQSLELFRRNLRPRARGDGKRFDQLGKCDDAHSFEPVLAFHLLHRGELALAALLPVQRERDCYRLAARLRGSNRWTRAPQYLR